MKWYKVIALSVGGRKNKIFHTGDLVNESNFPEGAADRLMNQGFLEYFDKDADEVPSQPGEELEVEITLREEQQPDGGQAAEKKSDEEGSDEETQAPDVDDLTKKEIMKELEEAGIPFDKNSNKAQLYEIWKKSKKE